MTVSKLIYLIAVLVIAVWLLGIVFRFAAWLVSGLLYIALIIVIAGLILQFIEQQKRRK